jgi:hypothetical protein
MTGDMDLQTPEQVAGFQNRWDEDGTKEGLENLLKSLSQM